MTEEIKQLVSKADRGDINSLNQLMKMAQDEQNRGNYKESSELFKFAAMAYRINASRQFSIASEAKEECDWINKVIKVPHTNLCKVVGMVRSPM
ncbi:MAG: hypothetical protein WCK54_17880, partial [Desulfuromonadales bacterium]